MTSDALIDNISFLMDNPLSINPPLPGNSVIPPYQSLRYKCKAIEVILLLLNSLKSED